MSLLTNVLKLWRTGQYLLPVDSGFSPKHLFAGRVGWWLDPLDFGYARQDSAGATAYTAVEQGVGMAVDKSANGLTFVQASGPAKPVVSARVNLLSKTEDFSHGIWVKSAGVIVESGHTDPLGGTSACLITLPANGQIYMSLSPNPPASPLVAGGFFRKASDALNANVLINSPNGQSYSYVFNTETLAEQWSRASSPPSDVSQRNGFRLLNISSTSAAKFYVWGADLRLAIDAHLPYQWVNTATDYDTAGFPRYLKFDGAATNLVGASGGGASTAFYFGAAVQFGKVGAVQNIVSDAGTNTGFKIRTTAANQIEISAGNGAAFTAVNTTETFAAGDVAFIELLDNGTNLSACLGNGTPATVARPAVSAGTAQMTLGKANNAASEYSGVSIYSAVYLKDYSPTAAERADYKRWALQRAGVAS